MLALTRFVVIGAGGLGCPALSGLAAAGARRVVVVDCDVVESHNLHRQVLFDLGDVGAAKAEVAAGKLALRGLEAEARVQKLAPEAMPSFVAALGDDVVVLECSDAPALKFATNDACVARGVPVVIAAALGLRAHAIAVGRTGGCYRCVFETPPPAELVPSCAAAGVLGTAVGTAGWLMALFAVALVEGDGTTDVVGALHELDLARGTIRRLAGRTRPGCPACAARPRSDSAAHAAAM